MDEPERMLDHPTSALERALLQEGRGYRAPDNVRTHTLAALGLATSISLGSGVLAWLSAKSWGAKTVVALSTATLLAAIPVSYMLIVKDAPAARPRTSVPTVAPPPPTLTSPELPIAVPDLAPPRAMTSPVALPPAPARASAPTSSALRAELAALDTVRSTLANNDPAGALSFLVAYFRTFPRGRLHFEAEVLRIHALAQAGQTDVAKRHAREFLKRHPNNVLTARVRPYAED